MRDIHELQDANLEVPRSTTRELWFRRRVHGSEVISGTLTTKQKDKNVKKKRKESLSNFCPSAPAGSASLQKNFTISVSRSFPPTGKLGRHHGARRLALHPLTLSGKFSRQPPDRPPRRRGVAWRGVAWRGGAGRGGTGRRVATRRNDWSCAV